MKPQSFSFSSKDFDKKPISIPLGIPLIIKREDPQEGTIPEMHETMMDVFYLVSGSLTFITGGTLTNPQRLETDKTSFQGDMILQGKKTKMHRGDWLFIPFFCPHQRITNIQSLFYIIKIPQG